MFKNLFCNVGKSKAQGTMEYLLIIAVIIVIALVVVSLLTGFMSPAAGVGQTVNKIGGWTNSLALTETSVTPSGDYLVRLANNSGEELTISNVKIGDTNANYSIDLFQGNAQNFVIDSSDVCSTGDGITKQVIITYVSKNGITKTEVYPVDTFFSCENYTVSLLANQCPGLGSLCSGVAVDANVRSGVSYCSSGGLSTGSMGSSYLSGSMSAFDSGFYDANDLVLIDLDLNAMNISSNVSIFGVTGYLGLHSGQTKCTAWNGSTWVNAASCSDVNVPANQDAAVDSSRDMFENGRFALLTNPYGDGNNFVRDTWNNLMWQKEESSSSMDWNSAMSYCNNFSPDGSTDWRLATVAEAFSTFDFSGPSASSYVCVEEFSPCFTSYVWTSSSRPWSPTDAYRYYPASGIVRNHGKTYGYYARCVRLES